MRFLKILTLLLVSNSTLQAQIKLDGDTIFVNDELPVTMVFPGKISVAQLVEAAAPYILSGWENTNSIRIKATVKDAKCTNAIIYEGKRDNSIVLCYKAGLKIDSKDDYYDLHTPQLLEDFAKANKRKRQLAETAKQIAVPAITANSSAAVYKERRQKTIGLLNEGEEALSTGDYPTAKSKYADVIKIDPENFVAINGMEEINKKQKSAIADSVKMHRQLGYSAEISKEYDVALSEYKLIQKFSPDDDFAAKRIVAIKKLKEEEISERQKEKERQTTAERNNKINDLRLKAAHALEENNFDEATANYNAILSINPQDNYAKTKLSELPQLKAQQAEIEKRKSDEEAYTKLVEDADNALKANNPELAKTAYLKARQIKPGDDAIAKRIQQANKMIADRENEETYNAAIKAGEEARLAGDLNEAKRLFTNALAIFKDRTYPAQQISLIDNEKNKIVTQQKLDRDYQAAIKSGNDFLKKGDIISARSSYAKASLLKDDEEYPRNKMTEIDDLVIQKELIKKAKADSIAKAVAIEKSYQSALQNAKLAEGKKDFKAAKAYYLEALEFKPQNENLSDKIDFLNEKIKDSDLDYKYEFMISLADSLNAANQYVTALELYNQALQIKPNETFPVTQIKYIRSRIVEDSLKQVAIRKKTIDLQWEIQRQRAKEGIEYYAKYEKATQTADYEQEVYYLRKFLNIIPTDSVYRVLYNQNRYADDPIEFAKNKIIDIRNDWKRRYGSAYQAQADSIPYLDQELENKYADINVINQPVEQEMIGLENQSINETIAFTKPFFSDKPHFFSNDTSDNAKITAEGFYFSENKVFLKVRIANSDKDDFITGQMYLTIHKNDGSVIKNLPHYISSRPIVMPHKEFVIIYGAGDISVENTDILIFEITNRLKNKKYVVKIPGQIYNTEKMRK